MARRTLTVVAVLAAAALLAGVFLLQSGLAAHLLAPAPDDYETANVTFVDANGTELDTVEARVADSWAKRYVGLSSTDSLDRGEAMLFVHDSEGERGYVMREMDFGLDIVFVDASGRITTIHHAPPPSETDGDDLTRYTGRAKWVVELPLGYANETGIDAGDRIRTPPTATSD